MEGFSKVGKSSGRFRLKKVQRKESKVWFCKVPGSERFFLSRKRTGCNLDWYLEATGESSQVSEEGGIKDAEKRGSKVRLDS